MSAATVARLLVVDDETALMTALCRTLELENYATTGFTSAAEALEHLRQHRYDILLTDLMMPEMDGISFLQSAQAIDPNLSAIMMTGHGTIDTAVKALQSGALDYILKPFRLDNLLSVVTRALAMRALQVENRELQQRVQERSRELEASNAELESFSYSVSHDLRAPLRAIDGFCTLFMREYTSQIPADGLDLLANVCAGTARMQRLIDDLLHLARFSRQPLEMHTLSMQDLVRRVLATLQHQWPERPRHLEIGALPECRGDQSLLEHVLTNILSNAFKFTATRDPARIEVGAYAEGAEQVYFVRDNGVGFDMKYADKLFGAFQRLHSEAEFPGTGIGLSIVRRIILRHGGRVWAQSRPQEGTTLYFSLPAPLQLHGAAQHGN
jgi:two-component system, sensor histidine kinase and response regulator